MRTNIPPIREQFFEAHVEIQQKDGRKLKLPIIFDRTTRPWIEFCFNLSRQANTGAEAEIAEDLFAGVAPGSARAAPSEQDLFGSQSSGSSSRELSSLARHFLFMGA